MSFPYNPAGGQQQPPPPAQPPGPPNVHAPPPGWTQVPGQVPVGSPFGSQQPAPPRSKGRGGLITVLVLLLVVTIGAGAAAWFLLGLGQGRKLWTLPYSGETADRQNYLSTWFTDKAVVRAQQDGISALDPASGQRQWGTPVPGKGTVICAASSVSSESVAILAYGKPGACTTVFAVDLATGRKLWDVPVKKAEEPPSFAVSGGTVVVNDRVAYGLKSGSKAWDAGQLPRKRGCSVGSFTGGAKLVRTNGCATAKDEFGDASKVRYTVAEVDANTGKVRWSHSARQEDSADGQQLDGEVLSTSPVVARESAGVYRILSGSGKPGGLVKIRDREALGQSEAFQGGSPSHAVAMQGKTLVVEQEPGRNGESVQGFDMDSGKRLWSTGASQDVRYDLVQGDGGKISAVKYDNGTFDAEDTDPFSLVTFDPASGEEDERQDFEGVGKSLGVHSVPYMHAGRLFLASVSNKGSADSLSDIGGIGTRHESSLVTLEP